MPNDKAEPLFSDEFKQILPHSSGEDEDQDENPRLLPASKADERRDKKRWAALDRAFWSTERNRIAYEMFMQGKSIPEICIEAKLRPTTFEKIISNDHFIRRLESQLKGVLFAHQVQKVLAAANIFSKIYERAINNIEEIPPEICLKEASRLISVVNKKDAGLSGIMSPKNINVFMNSVFNNLAKPNKSTDKMPEEVFDYKGLEDDKNAVYLDHTYEEPNDGEATDNAMDQTAEDSNEQGPAS